MRLNTATLEKIEAFLNARVPAKTALSCEFQAAVSHLLNGMTEEETEYFSALVCQRADGLPLEPEHQHQLDAYLEQLDRIAATPDLEPAKIIVTPLDERAAELQAKVRREKMTPH